MRSLLPPSPKNTRLQTPSVFQERAAEYDRWFEDSLIFASELAALQQITTHLPPPKLEIGSGPGRFAEQLGVDLGIDPAHAALQLGMKRGIMGIAAIGEQLPVQTEKAGTVFLLFTFCFLEDPKQVLAECNRVLKNDGRLVLGMIPADSSWGKALEKKKQSGNPYYEHARFFTIADALTLLKEAGFILLESWTTLTEPPENMEMIQTAGPGLHEQAGCCILVAGKRS